MASFSRKRESVADRNKNNYHFYMLPYPPDSPRDATPETYGATSSTAAPRNTRPAMRRVSSGELFGAATELVIVHGQREYRLRVTSNGKLILTA